MSQSTSLSAHVQEAMDARGMSRRRLAREAGLDKETVGRFLDGTAKTRHASIVVICMHLGIPVPPLPDPEDDS